MSGSKLTEEQLKRCEENKKRALAIRAKRLQEANMKTAVQSSGGTENKASLSVNHKQTAPSAGRPISSISSNHFVPAHNVEKDQRVINNQSNLKFGVLQGRQTVGKCVMASRKRFQVEMEYHQQTIDIFKKIPSRCYDAAKKMWSFDLKDHDTLLSEVKQVPSVTVGGLPKYVLDIFQNVPETRTIVEVDLSRLDSTLSEALMPFQKEGIYFGIMNRGRVIIADDMGLGKTIQAIGIASFYMSEWPLLVVTPSSVRYAWEEAFCTWCPSVHPGNINIVNTTKDTVQTGKIIILSYDMLSRMEKQVLSRDFKVVIFDESHFLKNHKSARTRSAQKIAKQAKHLILLSGTPALSRPIELYTQLSMLQPRLFPNANTFGVRYCNGKQMPWGWDYSGSSNMTELQLILEETVLIRRLKSDVMSQLPSKQRQMIVLDPSQIDVNKCMKAMSHEMSKTSLRGMERRGVLLQFFHTTGIAKIPAICNYIEEQLEADRKFICFAHHQQVLEAICKLLDRKNCDYMKIDGTTSSENRKLHCDKFQFTDSCRVAVLSITAANAGINLTAASLVIFAELFWNPGILTQAEDRAHRIGQEDSVLVQYLVAKGTADDYIWPLIQKKLETLSKAGLNKDNFKDADTMCTVQSTKCNSEKQSTLDSFFDKYDDLDDEQFWDGVILDSLEESSSKKIKLV